MSEEWRPIAGYEELYEVSSLGRVWSAPRLRTRGGILKGKEQFGGYRAVHLWRDGAMQPFRVHRLVAAAWHRPPLQGEVCRHLNGDPRDNRPENLAWGSAQDNAADTLRLGRHPSQRKTHCPQGHPYSAENTYRQSGSRKCRTCHNGRRKAPPRPDVCKRGHSLADAYVIRAASGKTQRRCRPCQKQAKATYLAKKARR